MFKEIWFVWLIALAFVAIGFLGEWWKWRKEKKELEKWLAQEHTLEEWKKVDPRQFEKLTALIFQRLGYRTRVIGGSGDQGIDVIAQRQEKRIFIQCKRVSKVQPKQIREFYGAIVDKLKAGDKGIFVTSGLYTAEDKQFAREKNIELIDGLLLKRLAERQYNLPKNNKYVQKDL